VAAAGVSLVFMSTVPPSRVPATLFSPSQDAP
jgi:hypothetical protein